MVASVWVWNTLLFSMVVSVSPAPVINATWGMIAGVDLADSGGNPFSVYFSIPYALPPVGDRRFAKPEPHPGLGEGEVYPAVFPRFVCPQRGATAAPLVSEDCLTLDVFVPPGANGSTAVMIYIHGGGFTVGASQVFSYPEIVTENDVIVVIIQYRLDVFGFLASGDGVASGNYALWDQNLAIRWTKDNIRAFGGDPDSITIYGQSAGSVMVGFHQLSPYSKGLFSRAILQSGSPSSSWAFNEAPSEAFIALAKAAGCDIDTNRRRAYHYRTSSRHNVEQSRNIMECLRALDVATLLQLSVLPIDSLRASDIYKWAPVVDNDFIPANPFNLLRDANYLASNDVLSRDVMLGITNDEGSFVSNIISGTLGDARAVDPTGDLSELEQLLSVSSATERNLIKEELIFRFGDKQKSKPGMKLDTAIDVLEFYYTKPLVDGQVSLEDLGTTFGDVFLVVPTITMARGLAEASAKKSASGRVYVYQINHFPARRSLLPAFKGMPHGEDIPYVFNTPFFPRDGFNSDDTAVGTALKAVLSDFAKTGSDLNGLLSLYKDFGDISTDEKNPAVSLDPTAGGLWPEFTPQEEKYLSIEVLPRVADRLYAQRVSLWLDLVPDTLLDSCPNVRGRRRYKW